MQQTNPLENLSVPEFSDPRQTSMAVRDHLRELIIDGTLSPGMTLKQAELARLFGVSRTPMREAFRMLQEEDLILTSPNQRAVVRSLDGNELDQLYGTRITLEALGVRITTGRLDPEEVQEAQQCLEGMSDDVWGPEWIRLHRRFHEICMARADQPLLRITRSYAERSERYVRLYRMWHPQFHNDKVAHEGILEAVQGTDPALAGQRMANHLAHTAFTVLNDVSVGVTGRAIQEALDMVNGKKGSKVQRQI